MRTNDSSNTIQAFWAEYQSQEDAPLQIKNMAIFLALQARCKEILCAIGLRGGYLDLAGFIGIPTFNVDTLWREEDLTSLIYLPANVQSQWFFLSDKINTFILIDFLSPQDSGKTVKVKDKQRIL